MILQLSKRLQNVEILNQDFRKVFKNYNAEYIYGTYGELLKGDTNLTSYLYNGKYGVMTDENGLYYMRHRYYNTDIRRFVNQDIVKGNLGNSQSLNRYSYVQGNPLTYTDPFGLSPEKDGGSIGMNIVHGLLDALGCVPGGVGIVANFANAALYAVVDHDYGMAALSLVAGVTLGASKIVSMGGKLAGHAKSIETIGRLVSNTASFAICAEQTVSSSAAMWNKYHEKGAKLSGETALEILGIGLNVAGMAASGKGIVESGNRLGKMVKEGGTTNKMSKGISESGSKTIDDIIDGLPETTNGKGVARNFESTGDFEQTIRDFDALNPIDVKEIQTKYGSGKAGKLSDGTTVVARPGSTTGGATLEIRVSNRKVYKIRY